MGQALLARVAEMTARMTPLHHKADPPFSLVLNCLAKIGPPALVVMPERFANTDPFQSITQVVGSGPFRFEAAERVVGSKVVYTRNPGYVPRPNGTPDWLAGPKIVNFDRVEWTVMPDPATAAAALENGEVDWWENPPNDLLPMLNRASEVRTENGTPGQSIHRRFSITCIRRSTSRRCGGCCCRRCRRPIS
jgi:peptide/nickel transport system substrate-binding protein